MPRAPAPLPDPLTWGPFTVREALAEGVSPTRLRAADLSRPFRGVRTPSPPGDLRALCSAYLARMPRGQYFSHVTAALLWGFPLPLALERDPTLHVSATPPSREPRMHGVVGHRGLGDPPLALIGLLPVLGPCETWCQLGAVLELDDLIAAGDRLFRWRDHLATRAELASAMARMTQQAGMRRVRAALPELREDSNSPRESKLRLEVIRAGFPEPEPNGHIRLSNGKETRGDLVFRRFRTILEFDGEQHRLTRRQWSRDVDRLNDLGEDDWLVLRVRNDSTNHLQRLDRSLRRRGWRP
jgi:hypothetical protein